MEQHAACIAFGFTALFFFMAMEEISWFQRVFSIDTPEFFKENMQKEMNFHNFATDIVENLYYSGAFVFLVALPFVLDAKDLPRESLVRLFKPSSLVLLVSASAFAYNWDMWNIVLTQFCFLRPFSSW